MFYKKNGLLLSCLVLLLGIYFWNQSVYAQSGGPSELELSYSEIGQIQPKHARDIKDSPWSVGGETLDRDFADYSQYKKYLGPLGVKMIRLQTGWAKTEKQKGVYDFSWLDAIVEDAHAQGVKPWLQLSYGNPIYEGGGDIGLGGGIPTSEEALTAWDRWVEASVKRYQDKTDVWEIWNEPDLGNAAEPEDYADLYIRTAEIVRAIQPEANLYALALADIGDTLYLDKFLSRLQEKGKLDLLDEITHHGYTNPPEDNYPKVQKLQQVAARYSDKVTFRQGEQGAPSTRIPAFALKNYDWTEVSQAKWMLRRMLGDIGHGFPSLVFTMTDLRYLRGENKQDTILNTKGLLATDLNLQVLYAKLSYYGVQHLASAIDQPVEKVVGFTTKARTKEEVTAYAFRKQDGDEIITLWFSGERPGNQLSTVQVDISFQGVAFDDPVYVDLLSGKVYQIPEESIRQTKRGWQISNLPLLDMPVLITEKSTIL